MHHFTIVLGLTACYFAVILGFVLYARVKSTNSLLPGLNEFFLAGKNLSPLVLTFTYIGSLCSTFTVIGMPGVVYSHGIAGTIFFWMLTGVGLSLFYFVGKRLRRYTEGKRIFSPLEVISAQYNSRRLGFFMALVFAVFLMPYISLQLVGVGAFIHAYTDGVINYTLGVGSMMFVIFIYLFLGGMRAVAYTDFVQISASFIGLILGLFLLLNHFDLSFISVIQRVHALSPEHLSLPGAKGAYTWPFLTTLSIVTAGILIQPHLLTRAMMAKDDAQINFMMVGTIIGYIIAGLLGLYFGLTALLAYGPDLQPNALMGHVFKEIANNLGLIGLCVSALMLMGALGAAMSTADSLLISIGQITTRDMVRPFFQITPERQVILSKVVMMILLVLAFITGLKPPQFMTDLAVYSAIGSAIMIPTVISFQWQYRSTLAAFLSIITGLIMLIVAVIYKMKMGVELIQGTHIGTAPLLSSFIVYYGVCFVKKAMK